MSNKLKILITNDDGIDAEGIKILSEAVSKKADVYVMAPDSNRSGVSHHFVMDRSLIFKKYGANVFSCSGFPSDCVISGVRSPIFGDVKFDAVLSGINKGPNMGTDTVYSGTIAGARQAVLYNIPGIAVSLKMRNGEYEGDDIDYHPLADFVADNLENLISLYEPDCIISINAQSGIPLKKVKMTTLCFRHYNDKVGIAEKDGNTYESVFHNGAISTTGDADNEYDAVKNGFVSIARLYAEPVNFVPAVQKNIQFNF